MAEQGTRNVWRTIVIVVVNLILVLLIIAVTLANWFPAIYRSEWFKARFGP